MIVFLIHSYLIIYSYSVSPLTKFRSRISIHTNVSQNPILVSLVGTTLDGESIDKMQ